MAFDNEHKIKKIKLSDGQLYSIFYEDGLRLDPTTKKILIGNTAVDTAILEGNLYITEIDDVPIAEVKEDILVQGANGEIQKQNIRKVLQELGVLTAVLDGGTLKLEVVGYTPTSNNI